MSLIDLFCSRHNFQKQLSQQRARLFRIAFAWSHDRALADDLVQETIYKALKYSDQLRDLEMLDNWLFRILANCWRDHFRQQYPTDNIDDITLSINETPQTVHEHHTMIAEVRRTIADLPFTQRQILSLVDLEEFSYAEVADILNIPIGTVMSRLSRARQQLANKLLTTEQRATDGMSTSKLRSVK